jgi:hypothetical protein
MTTSTQVREEKTLVVYAARKPTTWKRTIKVAVQDNNTKSTALTTQGGALGAPRTRPEIEEGDAQLQPRNKRIVLQVPNMEQCLGVEGLKKLLEEEMGTRQPEIKQHSGGAETGSSSYQIILNDPEVQPKKKDKEANNEENSEDEATSTPKAGQLTGAKERARQKQ